VSTVASSTPVGRRFPSHSEGLVDLRRPSARGDAAVEQGTREREVVLAEDEQHAAELEISTMRGSAS
jgi:hypothetical protein